MTDILYGYSIIPAFCPQQMKKAPRISARSFWSWWGDSNTWPADYESAALPTELHQHVTSDSGNHIIFFPNRQHHFLDCSIQYSPPLYITFCILQDIFHFYFSILSSLQKFRKFSPKIKDKYHWFYFSFFSVFPCFFYPQLFHARLFYLHNFFDKILLQEVIHILHNVFHIFNSFIFYIYPAVSNFVQLFFAHK